MGSGGGTHRELANWLYMYGEKKSPTPSLDQALGCPPLSMATTWLEAKKADRFPSLGSSYLVEAEKGYPTQRFVIKDQSK